MKKIILFLSILLTSCFTITGQTATDFTATDCNGISHNLFTELNAGSVIVMVWVMPCGGCIIPSQTAYHALLPLQISNPHQICYYLLDDDLPTSCTALSSWATANSISPNATFSNAVIPMTNYGSPGMPKIVVLGGEAHTIFYNENYVCDSTALNTAIINALSAANSNGIHESLNTNFELTLFPNPAKNETTLSFTLLSDAIVTIEIENVLGENVMVIANENKDKGIQKIKINTQTLSKGIYFVNATVGSNSTCLKFIVN